MNGAIKTRQACEDSQQEVIAMAEALRSKIAVGGWSYGLVEVERGSVAEQNRFDPGIDPSVDPSTGNNLAATSCGQSGGGPPHRATPPSHPN